MQTIDKKYFLFNKGINTESPLVGWPEGFTIDEQNFDLFIDGSRRRRPGLVAEPEEEVPPITPPEPPPVIIQDCFNLYTKLVTTNRASSDGFEFDPELQFETEANTAYWLYGLLKFRHFSAAGNPGASCNFDHTGDTVVFQSSSSRSRGFWSSGDSNGTATFVPVPTSKLGVRDMMYDTDPTLSTTKIWYVLINAELVVGDTPGIFGIKWGIYNTSAGGSTDLLVDSYITATAFPQ